MDQVNLLDEPSFDESVLSMIASLDKESTENSRDENGSLMRRYPKLINDKQEKILNLRKRITNAKSKEEAAECTFRPKINYNAGRGGSKGAKRTIDDLFEWKKNVHKKKLQNEMERLEALERKRRRKCSKNSLRLINRKTIASNDANHEIINPKKRARVGDRLFQRSQLKNKKIESKREKMLRGKSRSKLTQQGRKYNSRVRTRNGSNKENTENEASHSRNMSLSMIKRMNKENNKLWSYHMHDKLRRKSEQRSNRKGKAPNLKQGSVKTKSRGPKAYDSAKNRSKGAGKNDPGNKVFKRKLGKEEIKIKKLEKRIAELKRIGASNEFNSVDTQCKTGSRVSDGAMSRTVTRKISLKGFEMNEVYAKVRKKQEEEEQRLQKLAKIQVEKRKSKMKKKRANPDPADIKLEEEKTVKKSPEKVRNEEEHKVEIMAKRLKGLKQSLERQQSLQRLATGKSTYNSGKSRKRLKSKSISHKISVSKKSKKSGKKRGKRRVQKSIHLTTTPSSGVSFPPNVLKINIAEMQKSASDANNIIMKTISYNNIFETEENAKPGNHSSKTKSLTKNRPQHKRNHSDLTHYQKTLQEFCKEKRVEKRMKELEKIKKVQSRFDSPNEILNKNNSFGGPEGKQSSCRSSGELSFYEEQPTPTKQKTRDPRDEYSFILSKRNDSRSKKEVCILDNLINKKIKSIDKMNSIFSNASSLSRKNKRRSPSPVGIASRKFNLMKEYDNLLEGI